MTMMHLSDSDQARLTHLKAIFEDVLSQSELIAEKANAEPAKFRADLTRLHHAVSDPNPKTMAVAAILARNLLERELIPEEHTAKVKVFLVRQPFDFENTQNSL